ncbi:MAG: PD-(D/E)XK nuclease family transposase [Lachnospiraceae bacterium]|nr:PD-(D/E)XK nuclease family transposase [Lachnospiraceae bacterium]
MLKKANASSAKPIINNLFPNFPTKEAVHQYLQESPSVWNHFHEIPKNMQDELVSFCMGKSGLKITYDTIFQKIFDPAAHINRLESLLSALFETSVHIISILPREGSQLAEHGSYIIMDALVQLEDLSYANIEMQKIGYQFPLARADCYAADVIMRQYSQLKAKLLKKFRFKDMHKVYCIVLMEQSPQEFHAIHGKYIHKRISSFDTGIYKKEAGLHEDIFICLDTFRSIEHNITNSSTLLDAWMTFLSTTDIEVIKNLITHFPMFIELYQEITDFTQNPKELTQMLSKELFIMDRNEERMMVTELQEELADLIEEKKRLTVETNNLAIEIDNLSAKSNSLVAEIDNLTTENNNLAAENNNLAAENNNLAAENNNLAAENAKLLAWAKKHGYTERATT